VAVDATALLKSRSLNEGRVSATADVHERTIDGDAAPVSRPVHVLGLSFYFHDSAAALVSDGRIVAAAAEERFCRRKHTNEFPKLAIEYCLQASGLQSINDVDAIVFYEKPIVKLDRLLETLVDVWPRGLRIFARGLPGFLTGKFNIYSIIQKSLPAYIGPILFSEHHLSHAASAFYCSPFEEAAILTVDGVGEWETTAIGVGRGNDIKLDRAIRFPHSVGLLYSALTSYLGFQVNDGEWKVMGLAPYGEPRYIDQFRKLVDIKPDGSFLLRMDYFVHHYSSEWTAHNARWEQLFGFPPRPPKAEIEQHHEDLARSGQAVVEDIILNLAREARRASGSENLVIAGGVGLNSVANWKIERDGIFKNVWIQPAAGDDGGAAGAALLASRVMFDTPRGPELTDACLGPEYSEQDVLDALHGASLPFTRLEDDALVEQVADLIASGRVVGWFRGRMEFGPRALGARSILADATNPEMKAIINKKIKYREYFRPFAPAVPLEDVHRYFEVLPGTSLPFMLKVPRVRPEAVARIPAVTHEDGTGRVQTVTRDGNPTYYAMLRAVERRTGVPIVVNTSFNVRGEPIVCGPGDAINCFLQTGIDALVLGNYLMTEKTRAELDVQVGYARSDALEATIGGGPRGAAVVVDTIRTGAAPRQGSDAGGFPFRAGGDSGGARIPATSPALRIVDPLEAAAVAAHATAVDLALYLRSAKRIKAYRPLHALLRRQQGVRVIDINCGRGWIAHACAFHYDARAIGLESDRVAAVQARSVARLAAIADRCEVVEADLFEFMPAHPVAVVSATAGLAATDTSAALARVVEWIEPGGYLQVALPHRPSRLPMLAHFDQLRERGESDEMLFAEFSRLHPDFSDEAVLSDWFSEQILQPRERLFTYAEIDELLRGLGCDIEATSLNRFGAAPSPAAAESLERRQEHLARQTLNRRRWAAGSIVVWARRR
jgi:carbamoyltransferase